jgi:ADP-heptose:LPS heptosyltransferase
VRLISLQKILSADDPAAMEDIVRAIDLAQPLDDFADTAALIENLDLVLSVDTAVAHLVGALGKPVWIMNRHAACWRWLQKRADSPWYPTARLFRQPSPGDWDSVVNEVSQALREFAADWVPSGQG